MIYTVTEVYPDHVVLDGNHPLAGIALRLHLKVRDDREARKPRLPLCGLAMVSTAPPSHRLPY